MGARADGTPSTEPSRRDRVSVVIPVRDGERFLGEAIESALGQSRPPLEVIVVDDGSVDATPDVARSYGPRVRHVRQPPSGIGAAFNRGVRLARGDLLASIDSDDTWPEEKLELQLGALHRRPDVDAVFGHLVNVSESGEQLQTYAGWSRGTMLIRREALDRVGPFTDWRLGEFVEWYSRAVDLGLELLMLPQVLLNRRVHGANNGVKLRDERAEYARMLKAVLDRRRSERA